MKHTGPEVVHVNRDIFNQMLRRQNKRVTLVLGVVGGHKSGELSPTGA